MSPKSMRMDGPQFSDQRPIPQSDVDTAVEWLETDRPDTLVAYSRGGAVAMLALEQAAAHPKVVYVAPAWQRGWANVHPHGTSGVILHGDEDARVPLQDSCELAAATGMPLRVVPDRNHVSILKDKENPGAGIPVPRNKIRECANTLPDWGSSGTGSKEQIEQQRAFVRALIEGD
ncbi:MAG: hypothetical protein EBY17_25105 [Acidobacteriia bacterium]|nr:hypothetical protein [Terriglobia bacterium]